MKFHTEGYGKPEPGIDVKVPNFGTGLKYEEGDLIYAFDELQKEFWDEAQTLTVETFSLATSVVSKGRSGGWLTVNGLPDLSVWSENDYRLWELFEMRIDTLLREKTRRDTIKERINAGPVLERFFASVPECKLIRALRDVFPMALKYDGLNTAITDAIGCDGKIGYLFEALKFQIFDTNQYVCDNRSRPISGVMGDPYRELYTQWAPSEVETTYYAHSSLSQDVVGGLRFRIERDIANGIICCYSPYEVLAMLV